MALTCAAQSTRASLSNSDVVARLHGDEFAFLLDVSTASELEAVLTRLRGPFWARYKDRLVTFTMSLDGLLISSNDDVDHLEDKLETLLYAEKGKPTLTRGER